MHIVFTLLLSSLFTPALAFEFQFNYNSVQFFLNGRTDTFYIMKNDTIENVIFLGLFKKLYHTSLFLVLKTSVFGNTGWQQ
jgi:hypothetical protein